MTFLAANLAVYLAADLATVIPGLAARCAARCAARFFLDGPHPLDPGLSADFHVVCFPTPLPQRLKKQWCEWGLETNLENPTLRVQRVGSKGSEELKRGERTEEEREEEEGKRRMKIQMEGREEERKNEGSEIEEFRKLEKEKKKQQQQHLHHQAHHRPRPQTAARRGEGGETRGWR